jgi:diguanylate cyclase (GGDEF)-like protein
MAASDCDNSDQPARRAAGCLSGAAVRERLEEEVNRAGRHGTALSCLLVDIEDLRQIERAHGRERAEQMLAYVGGALRRELRRFDRVGQPTEGELLVLLPGADGRRGELVARRVLERLRAIKLDTGAERQSLRVAVGLAAWREGMSAGELLADTRAAAHRERTSAALGFEDALGL